MEVLGACGNCHTPRDEHGEIDAKHLAGGLEIRESFGVAFAPNITPDRETGLGRWSDAEIGRAIREGRSRDGRVLGPPMPFHLYRRLSDRDVQAIVGYLRTIPPVRRSEFYGPSESQRYTASNALHLISCVVPRARRLTCARSARPGARSRVSLSPMKA